MEKSSNLTAVVQTGIRMEDLPVSLSQSMVNFFTNREICKQIHCFSSLYQICFQMSLSCQRLWTSVPMAMLNSLWMNQQRQRPLQKDSFTVSVESVQSFRRLKAVIFIVKTF